MLLKIKQWESKYLRDFDVVKNEEISEEQLYQKLATMYYDYISSNNIEPFTIKYGRGDGFCIEANSHVGVITHDDMVLYIESMIPDLSLGKILYLQSQAEEVADSSSTKNVISEQLNEEENIAAVDYFIISLVNSVEDIKQNGLISELKSTEEISPQVIGKIKFGAQVQKNPAYDVFHVERTAMSHDILINKVIKTALLKAKEITSLDWILPMINDACDFLGEVNYLDYLEYNDFPKVKDYTSIKRSDYEKSLLFSKYVLYGFDPNEGESSAYFPEFMLDMNVVFEYYVTVGLSKIFKSGFERKKQLTLGTGPEDIPIEKKNIELDGYYDNGSVSIVLDTKNKYRTVLDRDVSAFMASNPDIYQQYYYAARTESDKIILVYPSSKSRTEPIGKYELNFEGHPEIDMFLWGLQITSTPKENKRALIRLARYMENLKRNL